MDIKFNIKGNGKDSQSQSTLIGCQLETSPYPGIVLRKDGNGYLELQAKWEFTGSYKEANKSNYKSGYLSHPTTSGSGTTIYKAINNIYEFSETFDNIPAAQCHQMNVHLFCALNSSNNPFRYVKADLYYLKFTKGGVIVRDLIPAINKEGIAGLYDKVNKKFYKSEGDEEFVAGPSIL